LISGPGLGRK